MIISINDDPSGSAVCTVGTRRSRVRFRLGPIWEANFYKFSSPGGAPKLFSSLLHSQYRESSKLRSGHLAHLFTTDLFSHYNIISRSKCIHYWNSRTNLHFMQIPSLLNNVPICIQCCMEKYTNYIINLFRLKHVEFY